MILLIKKKMEVKMNSMTQNAFVEDRQILDTIQIGNETIDSIAKSEKSIFYAQLT